MIIAIDGPAGTGKSTIAKLLAKSLNFAYFDTGAMYRSFTWFVMQHHIDIEDEKAVKEGVESFHYDIQIDPQKEMKYFVCGQDVTEAIRSFAVTDFVSKVAAKANVRHFLVPLQRQFAKDKNIVVEGRDMGTCVFPKADLKIFLTAKLEIRAQRRLEQIQKTNPQQPLDLQKILEEIKTRDAIDSTREVAPLKCAKDAYVIDTSYLTIDEVLKVILDKVPSKPKGKFFPVFRFRPLYALVIVKTWLLFKIFYRHRVYGLEHLPKEGAVIAPNHVSLLDPPAVSISIPEEVHFLGKASLFKVFFLGWLIRKLNTHPVSRNASDISSIKTIIRLVKEGKKVLIFPEGSRSLTGELGDLQKGVALIAYLSRCPIVPTYVEGAYKIWPIKKRFPKLFGKISCIFGSPIMYEDFAHLNKKEAIEAITATLRESLQNLKKWVEMGKKGTPP